MASNDCCPICDKPAKLGHGAVTMAWGVAKGSFRRVHVGACKGEAVRRMQEATRERWGEVAAVQQLCLRRSEQGRHAA